jgi:hypothetical protein
MDLINTVNNILQPHFYLVDDPYSNTTVTNFEQLIGCNRLFWKLNGKNKRLISANKQNELLEMVKQLNLGKVELFSCIGLGKYLILELF